MTQHENWQVSGDAAEMYERYAVPYILGPWALGLVEIAALQSGERVLDVACGTGVVARTAAEKVGVTGKVTGLDLNPGMIRVARSLPPPSGAPITWIECSAMSMQLQDSEFDVALCQQGLQFFPDKLMALREMHRVLVSGGRLALSVWSVKSPYHIALEEALAKYVSAEVASRVGATRSFGDSEELRQVLVEAGFQNVSVYSTNMSVRMPMPEDFVPGHLAATPFADAIAALDDNARAALVRHISISLEPYVSNGGLDIPNETNIATAHR